MSIPLSLLTLTEGRAVGMCPYGGPGKKKTLAIHSCPYPILLHDFDHGTGPLIPWTRRIRTWDAQWQSVSQEARLAAWEMLPPELRAEATIKPNPLIDIIVYDTFAKESYDHFIGQIGSFDPAYYNTLALDSLQEFNFEVQSFTKGGGQLAVDTVMSGTLWGPVQERCGIALRRLKNYQNAGVFIYLTGNEQIDKDYVTDPRNQKKGQAEEAYSVKGTVGLPGKLAGTIPHLVDIMCHAKSMNGGVWFVTKDEPLPGGAANWEAKDRFGRLDMYMPPNVRSFFNKLYGEETTKAIYASGKGGAASAL